MTQAQQKPTILIVEDEIAISRVLSLKLQKLNFNVIIAENGIKALEIIKTQPCSLIVLDIMMPAMNGFEFLQEIRRLNVQTPVIVTSNLSQNEDIEKAKKYGVITYFSKVATSVSDIVKYIHGLFNKTAPSQ